MTRGEELPLVASLECDIATHTETTTTSTNPTPSPKGTATITQTTLNIAKSCMGTGSLALPFAASQGGLVFNIVGLAFVSLWNLYSVDRLVKCADLISSSSSGGTKRRRRRRQRSLSAKRRLFQRMPSDRIDIQDDGDDEEEENGEAVVVVLQPPEGTSTFGKVAWHAFGPYGLQALDCVMIILLLGIIIAYEDAIISFLQATPFTTNSSLLDSLCTLLIITPLSCLPDVGFLAKFSAAGLTAILLTFLIIFAYALQTHGLVAGFHDISVSNDLWPHNLSRISNWFGVAVFGYGIVPITYNIQESMARPDQMRKATSRALWMVSLAYVVIGDGIAILYLKATEHDFQGDVLQHLPIGWIPTVVRLAMTFVVMVTAPLLVIPCGEILEGKLLLHCGGGNNGNGDFRSRVLVRTTICIVCTFISIVIPDFVAVISFIGCCCVALVSFVFPPLFYVVLMMRYHRQNKCCEEEDDVDVSRSEETLIRNGGEQYQYQYQQPQGADGIRNGSTTNHRQSGGNEKNLILDIVILIWGIVATLITAFLTFENILKSSTSS